MPDRFQVRWISSAEASKLNDVAMSVVELVRTFGLGWMPVEERVKSHDP